MEIDQSFDLLVACFKPCDSQHYVKTLTQLVNGCNPGSSFPVVLLTCWLNEHCAITEACNMPRILPFGKDIPVLSEALQVNEKTVEDIFNTKINTPNFSQRLGKNVDLAGLYAEFTPQPISYETGYAKEQADSTIIPSRNVSATSHVAGLKRLGDFRPSNPLPEANCNSTRSMESKMNLVDNEDDDEYEPDPKIRARKQWRKQYDAHKKREVERRYNTPKFRDNNDNCIGRNTGNNLEQAHAAIQPPNRPNQMEQTNVSFAEPKRPTFGSRPGGFRPASKFVSPLLNKGEGSQENKTSSAPVASENPEKHKPNYDGAVKENFIVKALGNDVKQDERFKSLDPAMVELIMSEIIDHGPRVDWDDVAGLENVKKNIMEVIVYPMLRPDLFKGIRGPPKGLLLFGPPGTGKTMIGKCIASQCEATFFSISASSLLSKWFGEAERMVRTLFAVARARQPSVIFIDEIDSMLCKRGQDDQECSRRIKTEFLVQLDGVSCGEDDRILMIGATNLPDELDEAARRRFGKRLYVPLPTVTARVQIIRRLMSKLDSGACELSDEDYMQIGEKADGYSGSDMTHLCREAALGPLRSVRDIVTAKSTEIRPVEYKDFLSAFSSVRPSVAPKDLVELEAWNQQYGTINAE